MNYLVCCICGKCTFKTDNTGISVIMKYANWCDACIYADIYPKHLFDRENNDIKEQEEV